MNEITRKQMLEMTATIVAGIMSNPSNGNTAMDNYSQQQAIVNTMKNLDQAFMQMGFRVVDDQP